MTAYRRLADGLPARSGSGAAGVPTDARAARDWVAALPLADRAQAGAMLVGAVEALNGLRIDASQRLAVLETLRPPLLDLLDYIEQQILGSSFPLPHGKVRLGQRARASHAGLALGYRMVAVDLCAPSGSVPFLRSRVVAQSLARAVHHQAGALAAHYLLYLKPAPGLWQALHDLYRMSDELGLADKGVPDPHRGGEQSAAQAYREALLLAICNPYRFPQREQVELRRATGVLAGQCRIGRKPLEGAFLIPEGQDRGPGYLPSERAAADESGWCFDIAPLRAVFERQLGQGAPEVVVRAGLRREGRISADVARRCMASWGTVAERSHQRLPAGHQLDTIIGLSAMHYFLAGERDFETFMRQAHGVGATLAAGEAAAWAGPGSEQSRPSVYRARVLDQSLGGYQLAWDKSHAVRARVGELVGLAVPLEDAEDRDWMLGIIRWLRYDPDGGVDAGVELLARRARAVGLRPPQEGGEPRAALRGIEFRHVRQNGDGMLHLLVPAIMERHAQQVELTRGADPAAFGEEPSVAWMHQVRTVEHTGDYLLLAGELGDNGGSASDSHPS
jgi:hypothetical protein